MQEHGLERRLIGKKKVYGSYPCRLKINLAEVINLDRD